MGRAPRLRGFVPSHAPMLRPRSGRVDPSSGELFGLRPKNSPLSPPGGGAWTTSGSRAPSRARRTRAARAGRRPCAGSRRCGARARGLRPGRRERERGGVDLGRGHRGPGEAALDGLGARQALAEQGQRRGRLARAEAAEQRGVAAAGVQADREEARQQDRVVGDDAQVGRQREVQPGADGAAADGRDRRRRELADAGEGAVDRATAAGASCSAGSRPAAASVARSPPAQK